MALKLMSLSAEPRHSEAESGFTLVELMIVVAIIGILAAVAIPNYQKYQAKARTSEGKIQLASAYIAEKSFFVEHSSYTGCLGGAGFAPDSGSAVNAASRFYSVGFNSAGSAGATCGPLGVSSCEAAWGGGNPSCTASTDGSPGGNTAVDNGTYYSARMSSAPGSVAAGTNLPPTSASAAAFVIGAAANIDPNGGTNFDQWSINEGKVLVQSNVGY